MQKLIVSREHLERVMDLSSRSLVGKILKRLELFTDREILKKEIKELIYENFRETKLFLESFSWGVKFVSKKKDN